MQTFLCKSVCIFRYPLLFRYVSNFLSLFSDLVPLTGSLKRPVSSHPMSSHLRVLHSPLSSGLNPEGIYVWDRSAWEEPITSLSQSPFFPENTFVSGYLCTGYLSSTTMHCCLCYMKAALSVKTQMVKKQCRPLVGSDGALGGEH